MTREEFKTSKRLYKREKQSREVFIPHSVQRILEFWKNCGFTIPRKNTKRFTDDIKKVKWLLRGKNFMRKYSEIEIKRTIRKFAGYTFDTPHDLDYKNRLIKMGIGNFIYNGFANQKSLFTAYYENNSPKEVNDEHPLMTEEFKNLWVKLVLNGNRPKTFSSISRVGFKKASLKLVSFIEMYRSRLLLDRIILEHPERCVKYVFNALAENGGDNTKIKLYYLYSGYTYDAILFKYFVTHGIMRRGRK